MSKLTRILIGATLTAINLAGLTAVAHAQADDDPAGNQAALRPPTERQVGESWRHHQAASQEQTAADATLQRVQARERFSIPSGRPVQAPAPVPSEATRQPRWLIASLVALVALALCGGLAVATTRRARRRTRVEHAA
jgi:hypothetical protein